MNFSAPMQNGGVVVADKIILHLEIEAVLQTALVCGARPYPP